MDVIAWGKWPFGVLGELATPVVNLFTKWVGSSSWLTTNIIIAAYSRRAKEG